MSSDADRPPPTIHRCGWCGRPTDAAGVPIEQDPEAYLAAYPDAVEEMVQGDCCPNGNNEPERELRQVTRDMAIDAGDRRMEGSWIEW